MDLKPYYKLTDFVDLKDIPGRQNYEAQCPCCKKHHLSISKKSGLFHCFTPECNFNGICDDFKDPQYQHKEEWQKEPKKNTDYAILDVKLSSIKSNPAVIKYLADQQIPLEVAEQAGCMSAVRNIDGIAYNCLCYVNRLYGSIINVKYRAVTEKKFTQDVQPKDKNVPSAPYNIECLNPLRDVANNSSLLIVTEGEKDVLTLLHELFPEARICGHHDLNPKKACPCYDAAKEYAYIMR